MPYITATAHPSQAQPASAQSTRVKRWLIRRRWRIGMAKAWSTVCAINLFRSARAMRLWTTSANRMLIYCRTLRANYFKIKAKVAARSVARICRMWPVRQEYLQKTVETRKRKAATILEAVCRAHLQQKAYAEFSVGRKEAAAALVLESVIRMRQTKNETAHLFTAKREAMASKVLQSAIRMSTERRPFLHTRAEGAAAAEKVQRLVRLLAGESGMRFKSIINQMGTSRNAFFTRMDHMVCSANQTAPARECSTPHIPTFTWRFGFVGGEVL
jgi:hypothetical protein